MSKVKPVDTILGPIDEQKFEELKEGYGRAIEHRYDQFIWQGQHVETKLAGYLLEYTSPLLGFGAFKQ